MRFLFARQLPRSFPVSLSSSCITLVFRQPKPDILSIMRVLPMPLRDHFHSPLANRTSWDVLHGAWPTTIVQQLNSVLPERFVAGPFIHLGSEIEINAGSFDTDD